MSGPVADPTRLNVTFSGGEEGPWRVEAVRSVVGEGLPLVSRLLILECPSAVPCMRAVGSAWELRGVTSYERYVHASEQAELIARQPPLDRPAATCAALIPVLKSAAWWRLPQDRRRAIFEERSRHIATGLRYLPAVARRLHHSRDLGESFDFLTWFEYAPSEAAAFEELVGTLRATEEWHYVEREVDVRLVWGGDGRRAEMPRR
jgi:hypothetical protein